MHAIASRILQQYTFQYNSVSFCAYLNLYKNNKISAKISLVLTQIL